MTPALRQNLTLAVLVLTGINMRPLLTSIGPLLPDIRAASGMSYTLAALLTALPVIAMGVLALAAGWVDRYIGQKRSIALSLLIIAAGALLREIAPNSGLLLTSALAGGIGIGIIQAAIPAVIKHLFPRRTPLVMGLWSAALMGGGGLGAAFTPWLASHSAAWHDALAWWALPALLALLSWLAICRHLPRAPHQTSASPGRDYWPAPRLDAGTLFRTDQCRLRQPDRLAASLLHPARRQRPVQRFAAGAADRRANRRRAAAPGAGSPGGSAPASSASAGATADWLLRLYLAARAFLCALGHCLRRGIGRRVSSVPGAGAGSRRTTGGGRQAGSLYAGDRIYHRRSVALAFRPAA